MPDRPDLGFGDELEQFDPADWSTSPRGPVSGEATRRSADAAGFRSREPERPAEPERPLRRRRTGRNAQFNIKARPDTIEAFCAVADGQGWGLGETLEHAVALLQRTYASMPASAPAIEPIVLRRPDR